MEDNFYIPKKNKYNIEKIYNPYRCTNCYKILRIKIFGENSIIKYNCQCKNEWIISYIIPTFENGQNCKKPKKLDSHLILKCSNCNWPQNNIYKIFLKCMKCKKNIWTRKKCLNCHIHDEKNKKYNLQNLNNLDYTCDIHFKKFIGYCKNCDKDICQDCLLEENNHDIIYYKDIIPNEKEFIEKYNNFNKFTESFIKLFKDDIKKTNYKIIYFFHFREIIRNIFINYYRYSKKKLYNFALISNIIENSDFAKLNDEKNHFLREKLKSDLSPISFLNSSKYIFNFLDNINNSQLNFHRWKNCIEIEYCYASYPKKNI